MRAHLSHFKSTPRVLRQALWVSLAAYWVIDLGTLISAPYWWMYRLGNFSQVVSISYITSFLFYYITIHLPGQKRKASAARYIAFACGRIVANWRGLAYRIQRSAVGFGPESITIPDEPTIKRWFQMINEGSNATSPKLARFPNDLSQELLQRKADTLRITDELLGLYVYELDHELFDILTEVKSSRLLDDISLLQHPAILDSLEHFSDVFAEYATIIGRLMKHQGITK